MAGAVDELGGGEVLPGDGLEEFGEGEIGFGLGLAAGLPGRFGGGFGGDLLPADAGFGVSEAGFVGAAAVGVAGPGAKAALGERELVEGVPGLAEDADGRGPVDEFGAASAEVGVVGGGPALAGLGVGGGLLPRILAAKDFFHFSNLSFRLAGEFFRCAFCLQGPIVGHPPSDFLDFPLDLTDCSLDFVFCAAFHVFLTISRNASHAPWGVRPI